MTKRILTTRVDSLPRSAAVNDLVFAAGRGDPVNAATFDRVIGPAVDACVERQASSGGTPIHRRPCCIGPVAPKTLASLQEDIALLDAAPDAHRPGARS